MNCVACVKSMADSDLTDKSWTEIRSKILSCGGLKEGPSTSHSFNDANHCDLTTMLSSVQSNSNADGKVIGISTQNALGALIVAESDPSKGEGGSWSTCIIGNNNKEGPQDVAHIQFKSRIAFKLVWCADDDYRKFLLVDDVGNILKEGHVQSGDTTKPSKFERMLNNQYVKGGIYDSC